jgi:hypothetical protein
VQPLEAKEMMEHVIYLPVTPQMPNWALEKMLLNLEQAVLGFGGILEDVRSKL